MQKLKLVANQAFCALLYKGQCVLFKTEIVNFRHRKLGKMPVQDRMKINAGSS